MKLASLLILLALGAMIIPSQAATKTVYVDKNYGPGGTGTKAAPYETINKALTDFNADTIVVMPGVYQEALAVRKHIHIIGYDGPHTTVLDGSLLPADQIMVRTDDWLVVTIEGLKISGGLTGVYQPGGGRLVLRNVIVCDARSHGVRIDRNDNDPSRNEDAPRLTMHNCILFGNAGSGLLIQAKYWILPPNVAAFNCLFTRNAAYGVAWSSPSSGNLSYQSLIVLDYNVAVENGISNYTAEFAPGRVISVGAHSFEADADFVGGSGTLSSKDFRLTPTSPLRDTGKPDLGFLDPDGTRNDIGAYGGPGARTFYTNPNDGPIVREVTVDKGVVAKGETFTIRARAAVR